MEIEQITTTTNTGFIDKSVTIQYFKEKKTSRTYITGLDGFMDKESIKDFVSSAKKKLGTAILEKYDDDTKLIKYGFNGDHRERIREFLIVAKIPNEKIKFSNS